LVKYFNSRSQTPLEGFAFYLKPVAKKKLRVYEINMFKAVG
jgi:hypothetical protein